MRQDDTATPTARPAPTNPPGTALTWAACVGIGLVAAVVALLPWLVTGMRLPLQNLWAVPTLPGDMPIAWLPFNQYALTQIFSLILVGYGIAGVAVRALRERLPRRAVLAVGAAVLAVHAVVTAQATTTVASGLAQRPESRVYLAAVLAVIGISVLAGVVVLWLTATCPRAGAVIGLSIAAIALGPWLGGLLVPLYAAPSDVSSSVLALLRWVPPVLVGSAIAWAGLGTRGRRVAAAGSLLLLWVGPAAFTAVQAATGSRVLLPYPSEMLEYGLGVLRAATFDPGLVLPRVLAALVVAAAGIVLHRVLSEARGRDRA